MLSCGCWTLSQVYSLIDSHLKPCIPKWAIHIHSVRKPTNYALLWTWNAFYKYWKPECETCKFQDTPVSVGQAWIQKTSFNKVDILSNNWNVHDKDLGFSEEIFSSRVNIKLEKPRGGQFKTSCVRDHFIHDRCTHPLKNAFWSASSFELGPVGIRSRASCTNHPVTDGGGGVLEPWFKGYQWHISDAMLCKEVRHTACLPPSPLQAWKQACLCFCESEPTSGWANSISGEIQMPTSFLFSWSEACSAELPRTACQSSSRK